MQEGTALKRGSVQAPDAAGRRAHLARERGAASPRLIVVGGLSYRVRRRGPALESARLAIYPRLRGPASASAARSGGASAAGDRVYLFFIFFNVRPMRSYAQFFLTKLKKSGQKGKKNSK